MTKIAVLDDWQGVASQIANWGELEARAEIVVFETAFADEDEAARQLAGFDIVMAMRERTAFPATLVRRLTNLKMFAMTGMRAASIDIEALIGQGVTVSYTDGGGSGMATAELALGLMIAAARHIATADAGIRRGRFQDGVPAGMDLAGKTLGLVGLGKLGARMARYAHALDMHVIAWSQNLTEARAAEAGARLVAKDDLLARSDVVSVHLVLSARTRGILGAADLGRMKRGAILVNTSRGPLIDEAALVEAVRGGRIFAALDVYDREPLPAGHPLRSLSNTVLTPHLGYTTGETYRDFYRQGIENVLAFLDGKPMRVLQPPRKDGAP